MLFNRKGINQKNWRMVKKGKHFLFGCTLFLATGAIGLQQTQVVRADEVASSVVTSMNSAEDGDDRDKGKTPKEEVIKQEDNEINLGVTSPLSKKSDELDKKEDVAKTEVNKQSLIELIEKIKNIDLSKKTIDSVEKLNLSLSRAQQLMESPTVSQEEVDKEEKALKESFEKLEDKPEKEKASESREKTEPQKEEKPTPQREHGNIQIIAIGISTGGPNALRQVFASIDKDLPQPIVVVQHMPPGFTKEFALSLDKICPLEVKEAEDGDLIKPGRILIAPGGKHLVVEKRSLAAVAKVIDTEPQSGHKPSVDVLFGSVAKEYQNHALGIIMTGMGKDGAENITKLYTEGSRTIGQDEGSSVVYGMPRVAWEMGGVMEQVSLDNMAAAINRYGKEFA